MRSIAIIMERTVNAKKLIRIFKKKKLWAIFICVYFASDSVSDCWWIHVKSLPLAASILRLYVRTCIHVLRMRSNRLFYSLVVMVMMTMNVECIQNVWICRGFILCILYLSWIYIFFFIFVSLFVWMNFCFVYIYLPVEHIVKR